MRDRETNLISLFEDAVNAHPWEAIWTVGMALVFIVMMYQLGSAYAYWYMAYIALDLALTAFTKVIKLNLKGTR